MYIHINIHVYICLYMYSYIFVYISISISISMSISLYLQMDVPCLRIRSASRRMRWNGLKTRIKVRMLFFVSSRFVLWLIDVRCRAMCSPILCFSLCSHLDNWLEDDGDAARTISIDYLYTYIYIYIYIYTYIYDSKLWEHEMQKFEIAVYTGTRVVAELNTANPI